MRIVIPYHIPNLANATGGVAAHVLNLAETLGRIEEVDIIIITLGAIDTTIKHGNISFKIIKSKGWHKYIFWWPLLRLALGIRREKPDIIHVQGAIFNPYLLASLFLCPRRTRKVITFHGIATEENIVIHSLKKKSWKQRLTVWAEYQSAHHFDRVICVTSGLKMKLDRKYGNKVSKKITVISNGVDCQRFHQESFSLTPAIGGECLGKKSMTLLTAKALIPTNGQEFLIRALPIILRSIPGAMVLLAGDGEERARLETISHELGVRAHVQFLGNVCNNDMNELLSKSDAVIIPSVRIGGVEEGSSILLLEAMAAGKPVVASDIGGLHDSIEDGETGLLVPERNPTAIADAVLSLHKHPEFAARIGLAAREYVVNERSWHKVAVEYLRIYLDLLDNPKKF